MIRQISLFALLLGGSIPLAYAQQSRDSLFTLLPRAESIRGWTQSDTARVFRGKDLYRFIDGGADIFFEYGFGDVLAAEYRNDREESINLEIYEMHDPGAAYGIYSVRSGDESRPIDIGQGGSVHPYYIMFWKGNYYISIAGSDSTEDCRRGVESIARGVDLKVTVRGEKPRMLDLLNQKKILQQRYVRGYLGLSTIHLFEPDGIFPADEGVVGSYIDHSVIIMRYSDTTEAVRRLEETVRGLRSSTRYTDYHIRDQLSSVRDRDGQTLCIARSGAYLIVSSAPVEGVAKSTCERTVDSLHGR